MCLFVIKEEVLVAEVSRSEGGIMCSSKTSVLIGLVLMVCRHSPIVNYLPIDLLDFANWYNNRHAKHQPRRHIRGHINRRVSLQIHCDTGTITPTLRQINTKVNVNTNFEQGQCESEFEVK